VKGLENHRRLSHGSCPRGRGDSFSGPKRPIANRVWAKSRDGLENRSMQILIERRVPVLRMIPKMETDFRKRSCANKKNA